MKSNQIQTKKIVITGLLAALVFVANYLRITFPTPVGTASIHIANVLCLLSGFLLGPVYGGLAAGIGSAVYDLTIPHYVAGMPFTLVFKFIMAFVCGTIAHHAGKQARHTATNLFGAIAGALSYVVLYLGKNLVKDVFFDKVELQTALIDIQLKGVTSVMNALIAVAIAVPFAALLLRQKQVRDLL